MTIINGHYDGNRVVFDEPVPDNIPPQRKVKVVFHNEDLASDQRMRLVEGSGALSFWDSPEEDIYSLEDGEPV